MVLSVSTGVGEPFQLRRRPDLVDAIRLRGDGSFFAVPAVRIRSRAGRDPPARSQPDPPFEDGDSLPFCFFVSALNLSPSSSAVNALSSSRRLALGRAVLDGTTVKSRPYQSDAGT